MKDYQTLKFSWLKAEASAIEALQGSCSKEGSITYFVFSYYYPSSTDLSKPIQLIVSAHTNGDEHYNGAYEILSIYRNNALEVSGPVIMSNNIVSADTILELINPVTGDEKADYLVFIPVLHQGYVSYSIEAYKREPGNDKLLGSGAPVTTNPSPPATMLPNPPYCKSE